MNKFYTGHRFVRFDDTNGSLLDKGLINIDDLIKDVGKDKVLSQEEWNHVLFGRHETYLFCKAKVFNNETNSWENYLVIFPDGFEYSDNKIKILQPNLPMAPFDSNLWEQEQLKTLRFLGCCLLPTNHGRSKDKKEYQLGRYWTFTLHNKYYTYGLCFDNDYIFTSYLFNGYHFKYSLRQVTTI